MEDNTPKVRFGLYLWSLSFKALLFAYSVGWLKTIPFFKKNFVAISELKHTELSVNKIISEIITIPPYTAVVELSMVVLMGIPSLFTMITPDTFRVVWTHDKGCKFQEKTP